MGKPPERDVVLWCSDASVLTRYGIETVNYGPSSGPRDAEGEKVENQNAGGYHEDLRADRRGAVRSAGVA